MKEQTVNEENYRLIRTDNGEWICMANAVFDTERAFKIYRRIAKGKGFELTINHTDEGEPWCYKHEIELLKHKKKG